jgi:hypothetical protein
VILEPAAHSISFIPYLQRSFPRLRCQTRWFWKNQTHSKLILGQHGGGGRNVSLKHSSSHRSFDLNFSFSQQAWRQCSCRFDRHVYPPPSPDVPGETLEFSCCVCTKFI